MAWNQPDSFHITDGAVASGVITDTYTDNGIKHVLEEVTGTPGMDYEYWFATVPAYNWIRVHVNGYYEGNPAHDVEISVWNFTSSAWDHFDTMLDASADADFYSPDLPGADYISGGVVKVRFHHPDSGNTSHRLYLDAVLLEDRSSFHTTVAPTTVPPTTVAPSTPVPTTTLTTPVPTTTLTTAPPTTPWGEDIYVDPIELTLSSKHVFHYNPPAPVNPGLDRTWTFEDLPIEITLSIQGQNQYAGILVDPIEIIITPVHSQFSEGQTIEVDPIDLVIVPTFDDILKSFDRCNFIKWSKVGRFDFTIDESNEAGERPVDWNGCIWHVAKLGSAVGVYGTNGVTLLKPSGVNWGMDTIYRIGLKNKGAFAGSESRHFFVDNLGQLFQVDETLTRLDYSEFISRMSTVILSLDIEKNLLYICDGTLGFVYSIESKSFGEGPVNVTGFGAQSGNIYVVSYGDIITPKLEICTDIYDFETRRQKTIKSIEIGTDSTQFLYASLDYRTSYKDDFKQIGWFLVNPDGKAYPKCYGVEFRFRIKSLIYEYLEIDYLKVRGHIHGFSYLDSVG
jgi:hypothetical protein